MSATGNPIPDWYPDPTGRFEQRYWDGSQWTEHVSSAGEQRRDPLPGGPEDPAAGADLPGLGEVTSAEPEQPEAVGAAPFAAGPETEPAEAAAPAPEWYPDPTGRYEQRYWDGATWTEHVTVAGQQGVDPLPDEGGADAGSGEAEGATDTEPEAEAEHEADPESAGEGASPTNPFASSGGAAPDAVVSDTAAPAPTDYTLNDKGELVRRDDQESPEHGSPIPVADDPPPPVESPDASAGGSDPGQVDAGPAPAPAASGPAPEWYPDPTGRHEQRYWDGTQWTEHASTGGQQVVDPIS